MLWVPQGSALPQGPQQPDVGTVPRMLEKLEADLGSSG